MKWFKNMSYAEFNREFDKNMVEVEYNVGEKVKNVKGICWSVTGAAHECDCENVNDQEAMPGRIIIRVEEGSEIYIEIEDIIGISRIE